MNQYLDLAELRRDLERCQRLTLAELLTRDVRAHGAFVDFTENQTMFWELFVDPAGTLWAVDWAMDTCVQWLPEIGQWV